MAQEYQVALILTVDADSYDEALRLADDVAQGVAMDGENIYSVESYERDNKGQRVLYLDPVST